MRQLGKLALRGWLLPHADDASDKRDRGQVPVVAGSRKIPGTALLASSAEHLAQCAAQSSAARIGPGLLDGEASCRFVTDLLTRLTHVPVILDALAMDVVLQALHLAKPVPRTRHAGEMAHPSGRTKDDVVADAPALIQDMARKHNAFIALEGATTFIASPESAAWQHVSSTAGLGTSGSGDVLAGTMTGLTAQRASLERASAWGVVLHALAGKKLAERHDRLGFLAHEIPEEIP